MADIIHPEKHADLIALQRAVYAARTKLEGASRDADATRLRQAVSDAVAAKDEALRNSGLVEAHDWYTAEQALKQAGKDPGA